MGPRIIALGQRAAGDDGVGLAVLERLRTRAGCDVELCVAPDEAALLSLLATPRQVVLVDALLREPAGAVVEIAPESLETCSRCGVSSHGLAVAQAIALARALEPETLAPRISIVAVTIGRPALLQEGLSPQVEAAVSHAAEAALVCARRDPSGLRWP
jgi:hydrogenase maturation protease